MSKKIKLVAERKPPEPQGKRMTLKEIIAQLESIKDNASSCLCGDADFDAEWQADIRSCDAVIDILTVLRDVNACSVEDIYELADEYNYLYQRFEVADKPEPCGSLYLCPECHKRNQPGHNHCWYCGKRLSWGSTQQEPADAVGGDKLQSSVTQTSKLSHIPTCVLVEELMDREGVEVNTIGPTATASLSVDGPAIILTVID